VGYSSRGGRGGKLFGCQTLPRKSTIGQRSRIIKSELGTSDDSEQRTEKNEKGGIVDGEVRSSPEEGGSADMEKKPRSKTNRKRVLWIFPIVPKSR